MTISIVVEDGTNVASANSFNTIAEARTYALNRGVTLSATDDVVAAQLIKATDYIQSKCCDFQGYETYETQVLCFPREELYISGRLFASDEIPAQLKGAQIQLVMAQAAGINIFPNALATDFVVEEKIGPITTKYADPTKVGLGDLSPSMTAVEALLKPLFSVCGQHGFAFKTLRV